MKYERLLSISKLVLRDKKKSWTSAIYSANVGISYILFLKFEAPTILGSTTLVVKKKNVSDQYGFLSVKVLSISDIKLPKVIS